MTSKNRFKLVLLTSALERKGSQEFTYPNNGLAGRVRSIIKYTIIATAVSFWYF